jgi:hypothetical protein
MQLSASTLKVDTGNLIYYFFKTKLYIKIKKSIK